MSGLKDVLSGSLLLLALWLFVESSEKPKEPQRFFLSASLFCALLAALAKPAALIFPLLAWALTGQLNTKQKTTLALSTGLAVPLALLTSQAQAQQGFLFNPPPLWQRPFVALDAIGFYLSKVFLPFGLVLDYGRTPETLLHDPRTALFVGLALMAFAAMAIPSQSLKPLRSGLLFSHRTPSSAWAKALCLPNDLNRFRSLHLCVPFWDRVSAVAFFQHHSPTLSYRNHFPRRHLRNA